MMVFQKYGKEYLQMKLVLLCCWLTMQVAVVFANTDHIVLGYYPAWQRWSFPAEKVDFMRVTHIAHAFAWPEADGSISGYSYFDYPELIERTHEAGKKIIISFGGWGNGDGFSPMVSNTTSRTQFVENAKNFCLDHGYDGVDLDWEYPTTASDRVNLTKLVEELRTAFNTIDSTMLVTIAVPAGTWIGGRYDFVKLNELLDWIGCMTYDFHGSWTDHAGHNAPLYAPENEPEGSADLSINYLMAQGVAAGKILLGLPFYGRVFNASRLYGPATGGDEILYNDVVKIIDNGWTYHWDDLAKVPYLTNSSNTKLVSYDDTVSVRIKCEYVCDNKLGGVKIWALGMDDYGQRQPLLETIDDTFTSYTAICQDDHDQPGNASSFVLMNNYPNPFNSQTMIKYYLPEQSKVKLEIIDLLGQQISVLVDAEQNRGWYCYNFNAKELPSGIYFYRLVSSDFYEVKKMTLLR
jgi:chitinase